jgi:hypothetical protein
MEIIENKQKQRSRFPKPDNFSILQTPISPSEINESLETFDQTPWVCIVNSVAVSMNAKVQDWLSR